MSDYEPNLDGALSPVGKAKELNELTNKEWLRHLLLLQQVKNSVLVVNDDILSPFPLEKGKQTPLGLFAKSKLPDKKRAVTLGDHIGESTPWHYRSIILGRIIFSDKEGNKYRDVDLKGIGYVVNGTVREPGRLLLRRADLLGRAGLLNLEDAQQDFKTSETLHKLGVRVARSVAIIALQQLIVRGRKVSVETAVRRGMIDESFHPVVEVRAFGTKMRINNVDVDLNNEKNRRLYIDDARLLVAQEQGKTEPLSTEEYLSWFAKNLGINVGLMHNAGWVHYFLAPHNITLDCRIVDFDAAEQVGKNNGRFIIDQSDAYFSLGRLVEACGVGEKKAEYQQLYENSYKEVCSFTGLP